jgi:hypothetical protein
LEARGMPRRREQVRPSGVLCRARCVTKLTLVTHCHAPRRWTRMGPDGKELFSFGEVCAAIVEQVLFGVLNLTIAAEEVDVGKSKFPVDMEDGLPFWGMAVRAWRLILLATIHLKQRVLQGTGSEKSSTLFNGFILHDGVRRGRSGGSRLPVLEQI